MLFDGECEVMKQNQNSRKYISNKQICHILSVKFTKSKKAFKLLFLDSVH